MSLDKINDICLYRLPNESVYFKTIEVQTQILCGTLLKSELQFETSTTTIDTVGLHQSFLFPIDNAIYVGPSNDPKCCFVEIGLGIYEDNCHRSYAVYQRIVLPLGTYENMV